MLLSIGDRVREGMYCVHSRFDRAVNFVRGGRLVSVVSAEIGAGPANLVVEGSARDFCGTAPRLIIRRGSVTLSDRRHIIRRTPVYHSDLARDEVPGRRFARNFQSLEKWVPQFSNPWNFVLLLDPHAAPGPNSLSRHFARRIRAGAKDMLDGLNNPRRLARGARLLAGCGFGLTPGGDDFLAGTMIALHLAGNLTDTDYSRAIATIHAAARTRHRLSAHFLGLARDGFVAEPMKNLIGALLHGSAREVRSCGRRVLALGETSGADLTAGFVLMLKSLPATLRGRGQNSGSRGVNPRGASMLLPPCRLDRQEAEFWPPWGEPTGSLKTKARK